MKFLFALLAICLTLAFVAAQEQRFLLGQVRSARVPRQFNAYFPSQASARDPRQNRGPVLFPPPPADAVDDDTSGVIVGASGYGFVPPQQRGQFYYLTSLNAPISTYTAYDYFSSPFVQRFHYF